MIVVLELGLVVMSVLMIFILSARTLVIVPSAMSSGNGVQC